MYMSRSNVTSDDACEAGYPTILCFLFIKDCRLHVSAAPASTNLAAAGLLRESVANRLSVVSDIQLKH